MVERISKTATAASVLLILAFLLWAHPDMTRLLRAAAVVALLIGCASRWLPASYALALWILAAPLAPALLRLASGREGPVLDIVWMAGLGGALATTVTWSRWELPRVWAVLLGGWALALALAWPVLALREIGFDLDVLHDVGAFNSWAMPSSAPSVVGWILYWVLLQLIGVLWLESVMSRLRRNPDGFSPAGHALWIGATAASAVALMQGTVDLGVLSSPFWASHGRATGTMLDANGYGHAAALAGPVAFVALRSRGAPSLVPWAVLAVNWAGMWMSGSRTALLCAVIGAAGLIAGFRRSQLGSVPMRWVLAPAAVAALAAVIVFGSGAIGPFKRLAEMRFSRAQLSDVVWDRGGYGAIAVQIAREYPLTGSGAGSFHSIAPDYYRANAGDALAPDNAQNWWRHQVAELGLLGGALVLIWSALVGWRALTGGSARSQPAASTIRALVIGLGMSSLFGVPTQNPVVLLWFFFLVAWMHSLISAPISSGGRRWMRASWAAAAVLAAAYATGHLFLARSSLSVAARAERFVRPYIVGAHEPEPLPGGGEFRWTDEESRFILPAKTRWLVLRVWASHPDIAKEPVGVTISTPCGPLWEGSLDSLDSVTLGVTLQEDQRSFDATVRVSRTWQPSTYGHEDDRRLGAGILADFNDSAEMARSQMYTLTVPACLL